VARQVFETLISLALICISPLRALAADQDDPKQTGPVGLIIQYKCLPGQRVAFRQRLIATGLPRFAELQTSGILAEYHVLFSRYVDTNSWDALALLTFRDYTQAARWRRVEETTPAGLQPDTLTLTFSVETYPVDLMRRAMSDENLPRPVYLVVPYTYSVAATAYLQYVDTYVRPQFDGWMREGILAGYQIYLQRYTAARPWDTTIFLKYKDDDSFGQREKIVAKVRAQLQSNPVWKAASDSKQNLRVEKEAIIADELVAGQ
jgi:hypothetical protein